MERITDTAAFLKSYAGEYPEAQAADYVKLLYQSELGPGHLIKDPESSMDRLMQEIIELGHELYWTKPFFEFLPGDYCRMNLSAVRDLTPDLINRIFTASSDGIPQGAEERFSEKLDIFLHTVRESESIFPFTIKQAEEHVADYRAKGCPAVSHSPEFRRAYKPAYRVIKAEHARFSELYCAIDRELRSKKQVNIAIDGCCGAGKSSAAALISTIFDCNVFHADDFFLPPALRTEERLREVGGNMERERFEKEVLIPVKKGKPFSYRVFDCSVVELGETVEVSPKSLNIFEGSYTMHPELRKYYDLSVFISASPEEQEKRILERNGEEMLRRFKEEWIPMENEYFDKMKVKEGCTYRF